MKKQRLGEMETFSIIKGRELCNNGLKNKMLLTEHWASSKLYLDYLKKM